MSGFGSNFALNDFACDVLVTGSIGEEEFLARNIRLYLANFKDVK